MSTACSICTGVGANVKDGVDGVTIAQRKKNLGLLAASYIGHKDCANVFIKKGADVNCTDKMLDYISLRNLCDEAGCVGMRIPFIEGIGWTPLIYASGSGHLETMKALIRAGADVNLVKKGTAPIITSAHRGQHKSVELLIEAGASVNITDSAVPPPLITAARTENTANSRKIIDILIKAGADVNVSYFDEALSCFGEGGTTNPLAEVAKHGTPKILSMLIEAGADVNMGSGHNIPLFAAALYGKFECIKLLVQAGADVNQRNEDGETPLHESLMDSHQKALNVLMELGADVNIADDKGITPLMLEASFSVVDIKSASASSFKRICRFLKAGAHIGRMDHLGRNSLQRSFQLNQKKVQGVQMFLYAAGETLDGPTVPIQDLGNAGVLHIEIPKYFTQLKENLELKHLCREAIRKHLMDLDPHEHLFGRIPQLGLPSLMTEYMMYNCSLDLKRAVCPDEAYSD